MKWLKVVLKNLLSYSIRMGLFRFELVRFDSTYALENILKKLINLIRVRFVSDGFDSNQHLKNFENCVCIRFEWNLDSVRTKTWKFLKNCVCCSVRMGQRFSSNGDLEKFERLFCCLVRMGQRFGSNGHCIRTEPTLVNFWNLFWFRFRLNEDWIRFECWVFRIESTLINFWNLKTCWSGSNEP